MGLGGRFAKGGGDLTLKPKGRMVGVNMSLFKSMAGVQWWAGWKNER